MKPTDKKAFSVALAALFASFREEADEAAYEGYWLSLEDVSLANFQKGVRRAMKECKFIPRAAELRELCGEQSLRHRAVLAFDALQRAVTTIGGNRSIDFGDPAMNATVRHLGGWPEVCELPSKEFDTKLPDRFEKTYTAFCSAGVTKEQGAPLVGRYERENLKNGFPSDPPRLFRTGLPALALPEPAGEAVAKLSEATRRTA